MKPECYHAVRMYSADGCCKCYEHWLEYMMKTKEKVNVSS